MLTTRPPTDTNRMLVVEMVGGSRILSPHPHPHPHPKHPLIGLISTGELGEIGGGAYCEMTHLSTDSTTIRAATRTRKTAFT